MCPDLRCFLVRGFWTSPAAMSPGAAAAASLSAGEAPAAAAAAPSAARLRFLSSFSTATPGSFCFFCLPSAFCLAFSAALAPASVAACGCLAGAACRGSAGGISSSSSWLSAPAAASACTAEEKVKQAWGGRLGEAGLGRQAWGGRLKGAAKHTPAAQSLVRGCTHTRLRTHTPAAQGLVWGLYQRQTAHLLWPRCRHAASRGCSLQAGRCASLKHWAAGPLLHGHAVP